MFWKSIVCFTDPNCLFYRPQLFVLQTPIVCFTDPNSLFYRPQLFVLQTSIVCFTDPNCLFYRPQCSHKRVHFNTRCNNKEVLISSEAIRLINSCLFYKQQILQSLQHFDFLKIPTGFKLWILLVDRMHCNKDMVQNCYVQNHNLEMKHTCSFICVYREEPLLTALLCFLTSTNHCWF